MKLFFAVIAIIAFTAITFNASATPRVAPDSPTVETNTEYSSLNIGLFMETCVSKVFQNMITMLNLNPQSARTYSFHVCGCAMDTVRKDMKEDHYVDMVQTRNTMAQSMFDKNLMECSQKLVEAGIEPTPI